MKSIKYIVAALIAAGLTVSSYATVTVSWGTGENSYLSDSGSAANDWNNANTQLANGDLLELGTWGATQPTLTTANIQANLISFNVFGTGTIDEGASTFGLSSGATASPTFTGNQIVIIAWNQAGTTVVPGVTEVSVFYENMADASNWKMLADAAGAHQAVDVGDLFVNGGNGDSGITLAGATVLWGGTQYDAPTDISLIDTALVAEAVPEPSSIVLVVLGLLGGIGMIRRHRS